MFENVPDVIKREALECETPEEILALAREAGFKLTDVELEAIAGDTRGGWSGSIVCPKCGFPRCRETVKPDGAHRFSCPGCRFAWEEPEAHCR